MARPLRSSRAWPAPFRRGIAATLLEAWGGYAVLLLAAAVMGSSGERVTDVLAIAVNVLGWMWISVWPAWRLRRLFGHRWWLRIGLGFVRGLVLAIVLGIVATVTAVAVLGGAFALRMGSTFPIQLEGVAVAACFVAARLVFLTGAALRRHIRRRLRWQLLASHALIVVLTLTMLTALGSIAGTALVVLGTKPNPTAAAQSVVDDLWLARSLEPLNRGRALHVLQEIQNESLPLRGEPPLNGLTSHALLPTRILLLDPSGSVLAGVVGNQKQGVVKVKTWTAIFGAGNPWQRVRGPALLGRTTTFTLNGYPTSTDSSPVIAEAPVVGQTGALQAVVVVQTPYLSLAPGRYLRAALAIFGASTVAVLLLASIPILAVSFLFAYVVARNLTGRLESVSQVTTAIAAGDLSRRAPVGARNEVGRLAEDVNRMAAHLETTMGELDAARTRAEGALRDRQALVANISHELRTPLAVIRAHLESLVMRQPVAATGAPAADEGDVVLPRPTLQALQSETERLGALIDDLFALSRAEAGVVEIQIRPVDVAALVDEVAAVMGPLARQEGMIALSVDAHPGLPHALADPDRLRQILSNLVRNAVRHTPEGGIIVLSVAQEDGWIVLDVADTGEGIPAEHLPHIFERFYRVDEARTRSGGGTGLGLAIVREFVELMGGRVTVASTPGEGACFRVWLQVASGAS